MTANRNPLEDDEARTPSTIYPCFFAFSLGGPESKAVEI
jgi:hypothetical protein